MSLTKSTSSTTKRTSSIKSTKSQHKSKNSSTSQQSSLSASQYSLPSQQTNLQQTSTTATSLTFDPYTRNNWYQHTQECDRFGFILKKNDPADNNNKTNNKNGVISENKTKNKGSTSSSHNNDTGDISISKLVKREAKWLNMIDNWDLWISNEKEFEKVKDRCRKGIPSSIRGKAWFFLSGAHLQLKKYPKLYERLERESGDLSICDEISKDLHRQFPDHELFVESSGLGQQSLFNVLKCFSIVRKDIGYCQGLAPIAAILIMQMPPNQAFWTLLSLSDYFIPGYYLPGFQTIQLHGAMLFNLMKKFSPSSYSVLKKAEIEPVLVMLEWFMCLFVRNLPWPTVLRLWDMFLCEGVVVIFKAAIIILSTVLKSEYKSKDQMEILQLLRHLPEHELTDAKFIPKVIKLDLTDKHLKQEHMKQLYKQQKQAAATSQQTKSKNTPTSRNKPRI